MTRGGNGGGPKTTTARQYQNRRTETERRPERNASDQHHTDYRAARASGTDPIPEQHAICEARDQVLAEGVHASDCCHPSEFRRVFCSPVCRERFGAVLLPKLLAREAERQRRQALRQWRETRRCTGKGERR